MEDTKKADARKKWDKHLEKVAKAKPKGVRTAGKYLGVKVTAENRRKLMEQYVKHYKSLDHEHSSEEVLDYWANHYARFFINKEKKHFDAYLKGQRTYLYEGKRYPVVTEASVKSDKIIKDIMDIEE